MVRNHEVMLRTLWGSINLGTSSNFLVAMRLGAAAAQPQVQSLPNIRLQSSTLAQCAKLHQRHALCQAG